jgi:hypothetical protein
VRQLVRRDAGAVVADLDRDAAVPADAVIAPAVWPGVCTSTFLSRLSTTRRSSSSSPTVVRPSATRTSQVRAGSATAARSAHPVTTAVTSTGSRDWLTLEQAARALNRCVVRVPRP